MDSGAWYVALRQKGHPRETQKRVHKDRSSRDWGDGHQRLVEQKGPSFGDF